MIFSLINVTKEHENGSVDGYWMQDSTGSLYKAIGKAVSTNIANGNKLTIAVVTGLRSTTPGLNYYHNLNPITDGKNTHNY